MNPVSIVTIKNKHMDIDSNLNRKGRTLVFGDAHGGFKAFLQLKFLCQFLLL